MLTHVKNEKILGVDVVVKIDPANGRFVIMLGDDAEEKQIRKPTLDEAIAAARSEIRRMQSERAIPVTIYGLSRHPLTREKFEHEDGIYHALLRGVHARTRALLLKDPDSGRKFQADEWEVRNSVGRRFTPEQEIEYRQLMQVQREASAALDKFLETVKIDPKQLTEGGGSDVD